MSLNPGGSFTPSLYNKLGSAKPILYVENFNQKASYDQSKLLSEDLLKNLDLGVLELWVVSFDLYRKAEALVRQEGPVTTAPSGYAAPHPGVSIMNKQASNMLRSAAEMGFTPSSRSRISVVVDDIEDDPWAKLAAEG